MQGNTPKRAEELFPPSSHPPHPDTSRASFFLLSLHYYSVMCIPYSSPVCRSAVMLPMHTDVLIQIVPVAYFLSPICDYGFKLQSCVQVFICSLF